MGLRKKRHTVWRAFGLAATLTFGALAARPGKRAGRGGPFAAPLAVPHPAPALRNPASAGPRGEGCFSPAISLPLPEPLPGGEASCSGGPAGGGQPVTAGPLLPFPGGDDLLPRGARARSGERSALPRRGRLPGQRRPDRSQRGGAGRYPRRGRRPAPLRRPRPCARILTRAGPRVPARARQPAPRRGGRPAGRPHHVAGPSGPRRPGCGTPSKRTRLTARCSTKPRACLLEGLRTRTHAAHPCRSAGRRPAWPRRCCPGMGLHAQRFAGRRPALRHGRAG